jgi:hypothetical protein
MADSIQVLTSLEYLGAYKGNSEYYFGVVLQVGVPVGADGKTSLTVDPTQAELLQPWLWKNPEVNIWALRVDTAGAALTHYYPPTPPIPNPTQVPKANPTLDPRGVGNYSLNPAITVQLGQDFEKALDQQDFGWADPQKQGASRRDDTRAHYPWPAHLAQLSRYPFPIPHLLNLAFFVRMDKPPVAGSYVATLKFQATIAGAETAFTPVLHVDVHDDAGRYTIPYDSQPAIVTYTMPLTIPSPSQFSSVSVSAEATDWQAHLVAGCADLFDLSARLVAPVRDDCNTTPEKCTQLRNDIAKNFSAYVTAVLAAQRDIVAYGCKAGPNSTSLLKRLGDRWVGEGGDDKEIKIRRKFADAFVDLVVQQLKQDQVGDQQLYQQKWLVLLKQNTILARNSLLGAAPASIESATLSDRLIALEHLQLQFTQADLLSALLLTQWEQSASAANLDKTTWQSLRKSAAESLGVLNVRDQLLQGNLGDSWSGIIVNVSQDGDTSRDSLRTSIPTELKKHVNSLLNSIPGTSDFADLLLTAVNAAATQLLATLVPKKLGDAPVTPTRTSEGISVLLGGLDANDDKASDISDNLRQMSGLCVLMREAEQTDWRCLDVGYPVTSLSTNTGEMPGPAVIALSNPIVIPVPQHNQEALRRATLTYNNQPLMCESPAHGFSKGLVPTPSKAKDRYISFEHPSVRSLLDGDNFKQWKIPGLAFGRSYDFLFSRVSNSGALSPSFADPTLGPAFLSFNTIGNSKPAITVPYLRTVPVADLRFGSSDDPITVDKINFPAIPADVHPRANEVYPSPASQVGSVPDRPAYPLVVLTPYRVKNDHGKDVGTGTFKLTIRKPTTDLFTWDRWKAALDSGTPGDSAVRRERINIWSRFHTLARQENTATKVTLDDPAVVSLKIDVVFEDKTIPVDNATKAWPNSNKPLPPNILQNPSDPLTLTFATSQTATTVSVTDETAGWTVTLPPGGIAKVSLTPTIDGAHANFFAVGIVRDSKDKPTLKPYVFLAESANKNLPSIPEIFAAFKIAPPATPAATAVDFTLTPPDKKTVNYNTAWQQVRGADLQNQVWRWDGRPSSKFPFADVVQPKSNILPAQPATSGLLKWELETFSARLASDATTRPMSRTYENGAFAFAAHEDRATELGAAYYRAAVTVYNRYGSLVPENPPSTSNQPPTRFFTTLNKFASIPGADGGWARRFVPARLSANASVPQGYKPPKPAIKYIVPLTGSIENSQAHAASVLIVVQGPWYAIAGLAEDIRAHITESLPLPDPDTGKLLPPVPEAGPDPILYGDQFGVPRADLPTQYDDYGSLYTDKEHPSTRFHGPVGHTFDTLDVNPLWVTCSFILDPPKSDKGGVQENSFARVQFRRVISKDGLVVEKDGVLVPAADDFASDPTDPVWIQFLDSRFIAFKDQGDQLHLDASGVGVAIKNAQGAITLSQALNVDSQTPAMTPHLIFGLLLTEEVPDLLGRKGQERYVDLLLKPSASGSTLASWKPARNYDGKNLIGRIVAIQRQVNVTPPAGMSAACQASAALDDTRPLCTLTTADELWEQMFPGEDKDGIAQDAIARIVAVSLPIQKNSPISCAIATGGQK